MSHKDKTVKFRSQEERREALIQVITKKFSEFTIGHTLMFFEGEKADGEKFTGSVFDAELSEDQTAAEDLALRGFICVMRHPMQPMKSGDEKWFPKTTEDEEAKP